ncbi:MAG TPA: class I SAM-dependent methyltransferase [Pseudonocardia sp.]|jgi:ubiquinone/menaquinone biosynthesis C-methylase UbiE
MTSNGPVRSAFAVPAESYDRMIGRFLPTLAPAFADAAGITGGMRVLDVGCGPGGLTGELVRRVGADRVAAVDPSGPFVEACRQRLPEVDVRQGVAETLPFADGTFDAALASLVVGFMTDPVAGLREMARVTAPGGTVAACFWDYDRMPSIQLFWAAAARIDPSAGDDRARPGGAAGELAALLREAGLRDVEPGEVRAGAGYADAEDWWSAFTLGVGPVGAYYKALPPERRNALRAECLALLGRADGAFTLEATAWFARGVVGAGPGR